MPTYDHNCLFAQRFVVSGRHRISIRPSSSPRDVKVDWPAFPWTDWNWEQPLVKRSADLWVGEQKLHRSTSSMVKKKGMVVFGAQFLCHGGNKPHDKLNHLVRQLGWTSRYGRPSKNKYLDDPGLVSEIVCNCGITLQGCLMHVQLYNCKNQIYPM